MSATARLLACPSAQACPRMRRAFSLLYFCTARTTCAGRGHLSNSAGPGAPTSLPLSCALPASRGLCLCACSCILACVPSAPPIQRPTDLTPALSHCAQVYAFGTVSCVVDNAQNLVRAQLGSDHRWQTVSLEELYAEHERRTAARAARGGGK